MPAIEEPQDPGSFIVREGSFSDSRKDGRLAVRAEPYLDGTILVEDGLYLREFTIATDIWSSVAGVLVGNHGAAIAPPRAVYVCGNAELQTELLRLSVDSFERANQMYGLQLLGLRFSPSEVVAEPEPPSEPASEPPSEPPSEPGFSTFTVNSIDLSGGTLFGYHSAIGGSVSGTPDPAMTFDWFYSNPADRINIKVNETLLPVLEGLKLVRDGVGEMILQGHTSYAGGLPTQITLPNLDVGLGITTVGAIDFHFEPYERTGPLQVSGRDNGGNTEWQSGGTFANQAKQGVEYDNDHPLLFTRIGSTSDIYFYGDTTALLAGKKATIDGVDYVFDDATSSDYNVTISGQTFYRWEDIGSAAPTPGVFYTVTIADV